MTKFYVVHCNMQHCDCHTKRHIDDDDDDDDGGGDDDDDRRKRSSSGDQTTCSSAGTLLEFKVA